MLNPEIIIIDPICQSLSLLKGLRLCHLMAQKNEYLYFQISMTRLSLFQLKSTIYRRFLFGSMVGLKIKKEYVP